MFAIPEKWEFGRHGLIVDPERMTAVDPGFWTGGRGRQLGEMLPRVPRTAASPSHRLKVGYGALQERLGSFSQKDNTLPRRLATTIQLVSLSRRKGPSFLGANQNAADTSSQTRHVGTASPFRLVLAYIWPHLKVGLPRRARMRKSFVL